MRGFNSAEYLQASVFNGQCATESLSRSVACSPKTWRIQVDFVLPDLFVDHNWLFVNIAGVSCCVAKDEFEVEDEGRAPCAMRLPAP